MCVSGGSSGWSECKLQSFTLILDDMTCNEATLKSLFYSFFSLSLCRFITQVGCQQVFPLPRSSRKSFADSHNTQSVVVSVDMLIHRKLHSAQCLSRWRICRPFYMHVQFIISPTHSRKILFTVFVFLFWGCVHICWNRAKILWRAPWDGGIPWW